MILDAAKGLALAMNMLTILPFFKVHDFFRGINGYAVMSYPLVGLLLGALLYLGFTMLAMLFPVEHAKTMTFVLWVILTGALHLDGFSDTIDGLFVPKEKAESVMKDPYVGGMGMVFTVMFLLFKASALWYMDAMYLLPVILMLGRYNAVLAIYFFPYIRQKGIGTLAKRELTQGQFCLASLVVLGAIFFTDSWLLLAFSLLSLMLIKGFFIRRLGGFSGDIYGFLIEVTELILLNILLIGGLR